MKQILRITFIPVLLFLSGCILDEEEKRLTSLYQDKAQQNIILQEKLQRTESAMEELNKKITRQNVMLRQQQLLEQKYSVIHIRLKHLTAKIDQQSEYIESLNKKNKRLDQQNLLLKEEMLNNNNEFNNLSEQLAAPEHKTKSLLLTLEQKEAEAANFQQQNYLQQRIIKSLTEQLSSKEAQVHALIDSYEEVELE